MLWHMVCLPMAHFVQVKNCKKNILYSLDSWKVFSRGLMNERIFSLVVKLNAREKNVHAGEKLEDFETHFRIKWC
jgi:hypothetical protein